MKEFALNHQYKSDLIDSSCEQSSYLISAEDGINAPVYAPNIKLAALAGASINDLELMFEARARAYDYDSSKSQRVMIDKIIALCFKDEALKQQLLDAGFRVIDAVGLEIYGGVGELYVGEQIASYALANVSIKDNKAIINAKEFASTCELINHLNNLCGTQEFASIIKYNEHLCDSANTRTNKTYCNACSNACPNVSISQDEGAPQFALINCIACAKCVAACPSSALDFTPFSKDAFIATSELYKNRKLALGAVPSALNGALFVDMPLELADELVLLHLVQLSAHKLSVLGEISPELAKRIEFINELSRACFGCEAIELELNDFALYEQFSASENNFRLNKQELLGKKILAWLTKCDNLNGDSRINYEKAHEIKIAANCTLCASCAGACKQGALLADSKQNAITFNASLCTGCGYCLDSCAETECMSITSGTLRLEADFFAHKVLACDELFACAECGKEFATAKAIKKIAALLAPQFGSDALKRYSIYCCADCKGALMMLRQAAVVDASCFDEAEYEQKLNKLLGE